MAQWEKGCVYINGIWIIWISPTYSSKYGLFSLSMTGVGNRQYSKSHLDQFPTKKRTHWEPQTHLTSKIKIILHISFFTSMLCIKKTIVCCIYEMKDCYRENKILLQMKNPVEILNSFYCLGPWSLSLYFRSLLLLLVVTDTKGNFAFIWKIKC